MSGPEQPAPDVVEFVSSISKQRVLLVSRSYRIYGVCASCPVVFMVWGLGASMVSSREMLQEFLSVELLIFFALVATEFSIRLSCEIGSSTDEPSKEGTC